MRSFDLGAKACVEKSKEAAIHSLMLDPLTSAICTPAQVREMTVEMFDAEKDFLPGYR
jgi:alpha-galactosidase